jgi:hypothetical protein
MYEELFYKLKLNKSTCHPTLEGLWQLLMILLLNPRKIHHSLPTTFQARRTLASRKTIKVKFLGVSCTSLHTFVYSADQLWHN